MNSKRLQDIEEPENSKCHQQNPGGYQDVVDIYECQGHPHTTNFVNDNPAGIFCACVLHGFVHKGNGYKKQGDGCNGEKVAEKIMEMGGDGSPFAKVNSVMVAEPGDWVGDNRCG